MPYVVTDNCKDCRFTECVDVCPVDCFYGDAVMLYIHPDDCIDCGACEPACPVEAIFPLDSVPADQQHWVEVNKVKSTDGSCANITEMSEPLPGANEKKAQLGL